MNSPSPARHEHRCWLACAALVLMLAPMGAFAFPVFGTVPGSNPLNTMVFFADSTPTSAIVSVKGGPIEVGDQIGLTALINQEWLGHFSFNAIKRPVSTELEVSVSLAHKFDPHPAEGDAGGGPTYSMTFNCTGGGVCAGERNTGMLFATYHQFDPVTNYRVGTRLPHNGPSDHFDVFRSSFRVDVDLKSVELPIPGGVACCFDAYFIQSWSLDVTGQHNVPAPSTLALLVLGLTALSLGRVR